MLILRIFLHFRNLFYDRFIGYNKYMAHQLAENLTVTRHRDKKHQYVIYCKACGDKFRYVNVNFDYYYCSNCVENKKLDVVKYH